MANQMATMQGCCCNAADIYNCTAFAANKATITANTVSTWKDDGCTLSRGGTSCSDWDYSGSDPYFFTGTVSGHTGLGVFHLFGFATQLSFPGPQVNCGTGIGAGISRYDGYFVGVKCSGTNFDIVIFTSLNDPGGNGPVVASLAFTASGIQNGLTYSLTPANLSLAALCEVDAWDVSFTW